MNELASLVDPDNPPRLGDGICETSVYNNEVCGFEFGDCVSASVGIQMDALIQLMHVLARTCTL